MATKRWRGETEQMLISRCRLICRVSECDLGNLSDVVGRRQLGIHAALNTAQNEIFLVTLALKLYYGLTKKQTKKPTKKPTNKQQYIINWNCHIRIFLEYLHHSRHFSFNFVYFSLHIEIICSGNNVILYFLGLYIESYSVECLISLTAFKFDFSFEFALCLLVYNLIFILMLALNANGPVQLHVSICINTNATV